LLDELKTHWKAWDALIDRDAVVGHRDGNPSSAEERARIVARMVDVLNRRNYIRNLVRDVNEALEN
jgi:hypothetical protein